jgi:hypothetical protein
VEIPIIMCISISIKDLSPSHVSLHHCYSCVKLYCHERYPYNTYPCLYTSKTALKQISEYFYLFLTKLLTNMKYLSAMFFGTLH